MANVAPFSCPGAHARVRRRPDERAAVGVDEDVDDVAVAGEGRLHERRDVVLLARGDVRAVVLEELRDLRERVATHASKVAARGASAGDRLRGAKAKGARLALSGGRAVEATRPCVRPGLGRASCGLGRTRVRRWLGQLFTTVVARSFSTRCGSFLDERSSLGADSKRAMLFRRGSLRGDPR